MVLTENKGQGQKGYWSTPMLLARVRAHFAEALLPRMSELTAAGTTITGGLFMLYNPTLMQDFPAAYSRLLSIADQSMWAIVCLVLGVTRLVVLLINGALRKSPWLRAFAAFLTFGLWAQLVWSLQDTMGWALAMAIWCMVGDYFNIIRAMRDARVVDDAYRGRYGNNTIFR